MEARVRKWGNSAAVRIPGSVLEGANLKLDDAVDIRSEQGRIIIEPRRRERDLDALVEAITPGNRHGAVDLGAPVGREID